MGPVVFFIIDNAFLSHSLLFLDSWSHAEFFGLYL